MMRSRQQLSLILNIIIKLQQSIYFGMAQVDQLKDNITLNLNNIEELINKSPLFHSDQKKWKNKISGATKEIQNEMLTFEEQVNNLPSSQSSHYVGSIKSLKLRIKKLQADVEKREKGGDENFVSSLQRAPIIQSNEDKRNNAIQEVMKRGDDAQDQTKNSLKQMNIMVEKGIQLAADVNLQLTKQIEQLDRMNDKVKDTSSTLQKAKKNIMYFVRALQCDMCMAGLLLLILLALVAVIVLAVKKNGG